MMRYARKWHEINLTKKLRHRDFSVLSQNCTGGVLYHMFGMQMLSPTVDMVIQDGDFLKLVQEP